MKASDIIQGLAELIDSIKASDTSATGMQQIRPQPQKFVQVQIHPDAQAVSAADTEDELTQFVPPLQAKIELLKKAVDVPSTYDDQDQGDELARMRHMAGIHPVVADEGASDEPLDI
jgi:hypothetical protein